MSVLEIHYFQIVITLKLNICAKIELHHRLKHMTLHRFQKKNVINCVVDKLYSAIFHTQHTTIKIL